MTEIALTALVRNLYITARFLVRTARRFIDSGRYHIAFDLIMEAHDRRQRARYLRGWYLIGKRH